PFPSSPHCAPTTTSVLLRASNIEAHRRQVGDVIGGFGRYEKENAPTVAGRRFNLRITASLSIGRLRNILASGVGARLTMNGKCYRESRTVSVLAVRLDLPAQCVDELFRDAETETGAAELARARLVDLPEILPDRVEISFLDSDSGVAHLETHPVAEVL